MDISTANRIQVSTPEWIRVPDACRLTGLSRSTIYELIATRTIKTSSVRRRGKRRGVRLIHRASLLALIESHVQDYSPGSKKSAGKTTELAMNRKGAQQ